MKYDSHQILRTKLLTIFTAVFAVVSMLFYSGTVQAQSSIAGVYPNGTYMFQPSPTLTFTASSPAGVTNVTVQLTTTSFYTGQSFLKSLTAANGLTITGPATGLSVSAVLKSNTLYSAVIQVKDANGSVANQTVNFDTITPAYTWEAEDYNYTNGQFYANPQTNAYAGYGAIDGTDCHNGSGGNAGYRPNPSSPVAGNLGGLATENCGDTPRLAHLGKQDYDVGWNDGGNWGNYTRDYPAGTYYVYMRGASLGANQRNADLAVVGGTAVLTGTGTTAFKVPTTGDNQKYAFGPLLDGNGNHVTLVSDGSPSTLKLSVDQGAYNANFYMLMPTNISIVPVSTVTITNVYPDGAYQFQATNQLSFNASSSVSINPASDVTVNLAGTNLLGVGSVASLTTANGLTVTGNSTNINVTAPLTSNMVYTAFIQVSDANGVPVSYLVTFDTIVPAYTFEAEDFNYGSGNFFDNPQTNAYSLLDGVAEVDFHASTSGGNAGYNRFGLPGENANDVARLTHIGLQDYDFGNTAGGNWANYTRTYPSGIYNILVRAARGNGGTQTDAGKVSLVTSDRTQPNQTVQDLGKHNTPSTGGWQKYVWAPVINSGGFPARFVADGTVKTLRYTFDGAGENVGFFMLMPADLSTNPPPYVSSFTPDGTALFQPSNTITFVANSSVGIAQSNVVVKLNGVKMSGLTFSGSSTMWNVSCPVKTNGYYTAIVTLTDTAGTTSFTNTFANFDASNYQWEAEDYNYTSNGIAGLFADNPQVDAYNQLGSTPDVDNHQADLGAGRGFAYRLNSPAPSTGTGDVGGEKPRANFTSGGGTGIDYNIGFFGYGSWLNYTRHYPAGTYYVMGRFSEGNNPTEDTLSRVTGNVSTTNQTATLLGTFPIAVHGWSSWDWSPLVDGSGKQVKVTLDGSATTLRLGGTPVNGHDEANVGFFMLVPTAPDLILTTTISGGNIHISFPTLNGSSYQVQYKNNLTDVSWTSLGSPIAGNGSIQTVNDPTTGITRFYRAQVQ
ncbi:MAG: hypothetical protein JWR26_3799 [Pedosphaera sp.]|nr:hypothetical protein [Pedosphaera sp.]